MGHKNYKNCVAFNSLSKRSNLPGLRSGYISGDSELIERFLLYRTYHGSAMPVHHQLISSAAWQDQKHVKTNRRLSSKVLSSNRDSEVGFGRSKHRPGHSIFGQRRPSTTNYLPRACCNTPTQKFYQAPSFHETRNSVIPAKTESALLWSLPKRSA